MHKELIEQALAHPELGSTLGYELIRDMLLPSIVGEDSNFMYWAGKKLAREIALATDEDIFSFFAAANWGELTRVKSNAHQQKFTLTGPIIALRHQNNSHTPQFLLETGFLAQTIEQQTGLVTEGVLENDTKKNNKISILIQTDPKTPTSDELPPDTTPLAFTALLHPEDK
ncbi:YslB family protein [Ligilactobacillus saerimneri]